jgi:hypothetical protein
MTVSWASCKSPQYIPVFCTSADVVYASPMNYLKGKNFRFEHTPYAGSSLTTHVSPSSPQTIPKSYFLYNEIWNALNGTPSYRHCFLKVTFKIRGSASTYPVTLKVDVNYYMPETNYSFSEELFSTELTGPEKTVELYSAWGVMVGTKTFDLGFYIRYGTGITIRVSGGSWDVQYFTEYNTLLYYGHLVYQLMKNCPITPKTFPFQGANYGELISKIQPKITLYIDGESADDPDVEKLTIEFTTPLSATLVKRFEDRVYKSFKYIMDVPACAEPDWRITESILVPGIFVMLGYPEKPGVSGSWIINAYYDIDFGYPQ